jgi:hypothetical protein
MLTMVLGFENLNWDLLRSSKKAEKVTQKTTVLAAVDQKDTLSLIELLNANPITTTPPISSPTSPSSHDSEDDDDQLKLTRSVVAELQGFLAPGGTLMTAAKPSNKNSATPATSIGHEAVKSSGTGDVSHSRQRAETALLQKRKPNTSASASFPATQKASQREKEKRENNANHHSKKTSKPDIAFLNHSHNPPFLGPTPSAHKLHQKKATMVSSQHLMRTSSAPAGSGEQHKHQVKDAVSWKPPKRSRSIAIRHQPFQSENELHHYYPEEEDDSDHFKDQELYDYCTWRMYNRIVAFRSRRAAAMGHIPHSSLPINHQKALPDLARSDTSSNPHDPEDILMEDGIFELEL